MVDFYHNGHGDDFAVTKIVDCMQYLKLTLLSPSENYPNVLLSKTQLGTAINASNILYNLANVTYNVTKSITLNTGFVVNTVAIFKTEIVGCTYQN